MTIPFTTPRTPTQFPGPGPGHAETPGNAALQLTFPGVDRQGRAGPDGRTSPEMKS